MRISVLIVLLTFLDGFRGEDAKLDENVFDSVLIENFKAQWEWMTSLEKQAVISKTGKLAFYMRLYRSWIVTPTGKKGFLDRFPEPRVRVNRDIFFICGKHLKTCVDSVYKSVQERTEFLFPKRDQHMEDFVIDEEQFRNLVTDSMFAFDITVSYLFCFFTKNRLEFLERLPFCTYGLERGHQVWPSGKYRDHFNNPLYPVQNDTETTYEPIDVLDNGGFKCADESFCPDPCCGRSVDRHEFCVHEICKEKDYRRQQLQQVNDSTSDFGGTQHSCKLEDAFNDDFVGLSKNQWNISCECSMPGYLFRFDTQRCVDIDECKYGDVCRHTDEECVNTIGGYVCACKPGFVRMNDTCHPLDLVPDESRPKWSGVAYTAASSGAPRPLIAPIDCPILFSLIPLLCSAFRV